MKFEFDHEKFFKAQISHRITPFPPKDFRLREFFGDIWEYIDKEDRMFLGKAFYKFTDADKSLNVVPAKNEKDNQNVEQYTKGEMK